MKKAHFICRILALFFGLLVFSPLVWAADFDDDTCLKAGTNTFRAGQAIPAGTLEEPGDEDWVRITGIDQFNIMKVSLDVPPGMDYDLEVYDDSCSYLAGSFSFDDADEEVVIAVDSGEAYRLHVYGLSASDYGQDYTLSTSFPSEKISHAEAVTLLNRAGITISSSGNCSDRDQGSCTSLEQVRLASALRVIQFKNLSNCSVNITGGTETGHSGGTYSHWNGYKIDISFSSCVDDFIETVFTSIGSRSNGDPGYEDGGGNTYWKEDDHWDILFNGAGDVSILEQNCPFDSKDPLFPDFAAPGGSVCEYTGGGGGGGGDIDKDPIDWNKNDRYENKDWPRAVIDFGTIRVGEKGHEVRRFDNDIHRDIGIFDDGSRATLYASWEAPYRGALGTISNKTEGPFDLDYGQRWELGSQEGQDIGIGFSPLGTGNYNAKLYVWWDHRSFFYPGAIYTVKGSAVDPNRHVAPAPFIPTDQVSLPSPKDVQLIPVDAGTVHVSWKWCGDESFDPSMCDFPPEVLTQEPAFFRISRRTDGGEMRHLADVPISQREYTDLNTGEGNILQYHVASVSPFEKVFGNATSAYFQRMVPLSQGVIRSSWNEIYLELLNDRHFPSDIRLGGVPGNPADLSAYDLQVHIAEAEPQMCQLFYKNDRWRNVYSRVFLARSGQMWRFDPTADLREVNEFNDFSKIYAVGMKCFGDIHTIQLAGWELVHRQAAPRQDKERPDSVTLDPFLYRLTGSEAFVDTRDGRVPDLARQGSPLRGIDLSDYKLEIELAEGHPGMEVTLFYKDPAWNPLSSETFVMGDSGIFEFDPLEKAAEAGFSLSEIWGVGAIVQGEAEDGSKVGAESVREIRLIRR